MGRKAMKLVTINCALHLKADVDRLYARLLAGKKATEE